MEKKIRPIYYASYNFGEDTDKKIIYTAVIERHLQTRGKKRMSFHDYGYDRIYGLSTRSDNAKYFDTREEAERFLDGLKATDISWWYEEKEWKLVRLAGEWTDRDGAVFDYLHGIKAGTVEGSTK